MQKIRVGVLRGGSGIGYDTSLKTGKAVLNSLPSEKYDPIDIFIDRDGEWHVGGYPLSPDRALKHVDVAWNALLGEHAAGNIQRTLENLGIPYTGSESLTSAVAAHRLHGRKRMAEHGIRTPLSTHFDARTQNRDHIFELFRTFPHPVNVSSVWNTSPRERAGSYDELQRAIETYTMEHPVVFIDVHIPGTTVFVLTVEHMRGEDLYAASPVQESGEVARLTETEREEIWNTARRAHTALGARHYALSELVVSPRGIYLIETNTAPVLHEGAPLQHALNAVGVPLPHFLDHVLDLSRGPKK